VGECTMASAVNRMYSTSYEEIANGAPLRKKSQSPTENRSPNRRNLSPSSRSPSRRMPATGESGREIRSLKREIEGLEIQNHKLLKEAKSRNKQVDALDALLQRERDALHDVLGAARKRVKDVEKERDDALADLTEESKKVLSLELKMTNMRADHQRKTQVLTEQNTKLKDELAYLRADFTASKEAHAKQLDREREEYHRGLEIMQTTHAQAESRWTSQKLALTSTVDRQYSMLHIWRELIADLRLRLKYLIMWIWGFRRWHHNVQLIQLEAHEEALQMFEEPPPPEPDLDDFHIEAWDIKSIAAAEFGMVDADGDGMLD